MLLNLSRHFVNGGVKRFRRLQQELQPSVDIAGLRIRISTHVFRVNQLLALSSGSALTAVLFRKLALGRRRMLRWFQSLLTRAEDALDTMSS
jgi:hypothetical protein